MSSCIISSNYNTAIKYNSIRDLELEESVDSGNCYKQMITRTYIEINNCPYHQYYV